MNLRKLLFGKRLIVLIGVLLTMAAAPVGILTFNQYMSAEATVSDALRRDAEAYATEWSITVDEAIRRLQLQSDIGAFGALLEKDESNTYAGHWIKHGTSASDFGMVVRFTQDGEATIQDYAQYVENGTLANMVELRTATRTLMDLTTTLKDSVESLSPLGFRVESSVDVQTNQIEIYVEDKSALESAMANANLDLGEAVNLIKVDRLSRPMSDIYGGISLWDDSRDEYVCTAGFAVEHTDGTKGITTADHCDDDLSYDDTTLPREGGTYVGYVDLQWHSAPGFTVRNMIQDGQDADDTRDIDSTKHYNNQSVGEHVCMRGLTSGYRCGNIKTKLFWPSPPGCPDCFSPGWVKVHKNGLSLFVDEGDSGAPIFSGTTAYGSIAFQAPDGGGVYMAVNQFANLGISVLTE